MIVKGILKTINYNDNSCTVRIPLFEGAATSGEVVLDAIFLSQPGTYNGYNEGDIVFVDFENDSLDSPIILGKVFLGAAVEKASAKKSGMSIASLEVSSNASLPIDTKLTSNSSSSIANVDKGINSYKSIVDIIKALHSTETNIEKLDKQSTEVIANIKIEYLSQEIILPEPTSSDEKWQTSTPEFRDGYAIWQKTTWHNHRGQILNTEIICLTELASSATYRLRCSTRTHYGDQQNEKITITAMVKLGSNFETEDTREGLSFTYSWGADGDKISVDGNKLEIDRTTSTFENKTIYVSAKFNGEEFDSETITYVPLNTPTLTLSSDSSFIEYDSYGLSKIDKNKTVKSVAAVKLNNSDLTDVSFSWTLNNCIAKNNITNQAEIEITDLDQSVDIAYAECNATYIDNLGQTKTLSKVFTIAKNKQGKSQYKIDIYNDYVTILTDEEGNISDTLKTQLPSLTTHTLSCYYGDDLLTIDEYLEESSANLSNWVNDINYRVVYSLKNVEVYEDEKIKAPDFAVSELSANTGYITYSLYRGTNKVAVAKFEISKLMQGVSATSYWVDYSARVHKGINQQDTITATAWKKFGNSENTQNNELSIRFGWRQKDGTFGEFGEVTNGQVTVLANDFKNADMIFELGKLSEENEFEVSDSEIITYSPIDTPVLDLSNDRATLVYKPNGEKIGEGTVSSIATVYLDGQELTDGVEYIWSNGITTNEITISEITEETEEFICIAKINNQALFKNEVELKKVFTISKQIQGENSISYWLKLSSMVHLGVNQQKAITITAMQKIGTESIEDTDESAKLYYKYGKYEDDSEWILVENEDKSTHTLTLSSVENKDIVIKALHNETEYETETITYSPLNTPVLDLSNDTDTILYSADGNELLGNSVNSKATLYLNGDNLGETETVTYVWELIDCSIDAKETIKNYSGQMITIAHLEKDSGYATCTATVQTGQFANKSYTKNFTVSKTKKGDNAIVYSLMLDHSSIQVNPNLGSKSPESLTGTCYIHNGDAIQPFENATVKYKIDLEEEKSLITDANGQFNISTEFVDTQVEVSLLVDNVVVDKEVVKIITDGVNAVSPYAIDIYNDTVTVLTETEELIEYNWQDKTIHKIKILQGADIIDFSNVSIKAAPYIKEDNDKDLVLTYELNNILDSQFKEGSSTVDEKIYYIEGTKDDSSLISQIRYTLYASEKVVATEYFEFAKILTGVSFRGVTNMYYATANADANTENPANNGEKLPALDEKDDQGNKKWKENISDTGYGETKPYLWNYEIITYSSGDPTTTPIALLGSRGRGIKSFNEYYLLTNTSTAPEKPDSGNEGDWKTIQNGGPTQPTSDNPYLWNVEKIEYTDGEIEFTDPALIGTYTRSVVAVNNYYYATKTEIETIPNKGDSAWKTSITESGFDAEYKYLWNYEEIIYDRALTDGANDKSKTTDVEIISIWSKEVSEIKEFYCISNSLSSDEFIDEDWDEDLKVPTSEKPYLWNKETTYYTDGTNSSTSPIIISTFARSITGVKNYYFATTAEELPEKPEWKTSIESAEFSPVNKYLWNYEEITYDLPLSNGETTSTTVPEIISTWSKSIDKIEEFYLVSKSNNETDFETKANGNWSKTAVAPDSTYPYLWNYEKTTYSDGEEKETNPIIIGTYGETFGVNIIPSVSSIIGTEGSTSWSYSPTSLNVKFNEVSGTSVIDCADSNREYQYKLYKDNEINAFENNILNSNNKTVTISLPTEEVKSYTIELLLNNNGTWVIVDSENIPVVREGNDGLQGDPGVSIVSQTTYYALVAPSYTAGQLLTPENSDEGLKIKDISENNLYQKGHAIIEIWSNTPPAHISSTMNDGWKYWTTIRTENSIGNVWFSTPIINEDVSGAYALAQGKTTNYYQDNDPTTPEGGSHLVKIGDCWFDTSQSLIKVNSTLDKAVNENGSFAQKDQYIGYYYENDKAYTLITRDNIDALVENEYIKLNETPAYKEEQNCLKQWNGSTWEDIGSELVANKLTANYINALDITAKKVTIINKNNSGILFDANGLIEDPYVTIAGFKVTSNGIISGGDGHKTSLNDDDKPGVYIGPDGISIGDGFKVTAGNDGKTNITLSNELLNELKAATYIINSNTTQIIKNPNTGNYSQNQVELQFFKKLGNDVPELINKNENYFIYKINSETTYLNDLDKIIITAEEYEEYAPNIEVGIYLSTAPNTPLATKTVSVINDGSNAVSPYTLDIFNDKVSALTNTNNIDWNENTWKENTTHKIKVLQGVTNIPSNNVTVTPNYVPNSADNLVLTYSLANIEANQVKQDTATANEKVFYITGLNNDKDSCEVNYTLYYKGNAVATAKFEFLKVKFGESGRSIVSVTNYYFATTTDSDSTLPPKTAISETTKDASKGYWKTSITSTGYGTNAPYLWNFEQITYDKALNGKTTSETAEEIISYWASNGSAATTYWIKGVETTHAGSNQTSTIPVTAMKRAGNEPEQIDSGTTGAVIWYNNDGTWKSKLGGSNAADCHTLNFNPGEFYDGYDLKLILTHDKTWTPSASTDSTDSHVEEWEVITYSPTTAPVIDLSNDSAQIYYAADGTTAKNEVSSTAALYLAGQKLTSTNISYSWAVTSGECTFKDNITNTATTIITALNTDSATITCTININANGIDGKFKNTSYQKIFSITKVKDGAEGKGISEIIELYQVTASATPSPEEPSIDEVKNKTAQSTDWSNNWSTTLQQPNATNPYLWNVEIIRYTTGDPEITTPAIIGTYGESFGANIIPSVASIIEKKNADGSIIYEPATLTLTFNEVSGTTVIPCAHSSRNYKFQIWQYKKDEITGEVVKETDPSVAPFAEDTLGRVDPDDESKLLYENGYTLNLNSHPTEGQYQVDLCLNNGKDANGNDIWIIVDTENIPIVAEAKSSLACVIESSLGSSFNASITDINATTTTLTARLFEGLEEIDTEHEWYYEWYWIDKDHPNGVVIENVAGYTAGSNVIQLKLSDLQNKSVYFVVYTSGAPSSDSATIGIARLGAIPLGK